MKQTMFFGIFAAAWILIFVYTAVLHRRQARLEGDLNALRRRVEKRAS